VKRGYRGKVCCDNRLSRHTAEDLRGGIEVHHGVPLSNFLGIAELDTSIQDWGAAVVIKELERQEKEGPANLDNRQVDDGVTQCPSPL
jgi:hypothetical protein